MKITVSPSILSSDFANLAAEVGRMERAGADWLHVDVMDGHFVKNITIGPPVVKALREKTPLFLDVHLMIESPISYIDAFAAAGADLITFHLEAADDPGKVIEKIRACGKKAGVSVKPGTPAEAMLPFLEQIDLALVMTVEPGFGGQAFMEDMLKKVSFLRRCRPDVKIQVDGGIDEKTAPRAVAAGADVLVSGSYLFGQKDPRAAILALKGER